MQDRLPETGRPEVLLNLKGTDLLGLPIASPRATHPVVYVLPLLTILTNKGTGIVTSVPSDAPDDYAALQVRILHSFWLLHCSFWLFGVELRDFLHAEFLCQALGCCFF